MKLASPAIGQVNNVAQGRLFVEGRRRLVDDDGRGEGHDIDAGDGTVVDICRDRDVRAGHVGHREDARLCSGRLDVSDSDTGDRDVIHIDQIDTDTGKAFRTLQCRVASNW